MIAFVQPVLVLAALGAALSGWMALSLAMSRHWQNQHGRGTETSSTQRRTLQAAGAAGLLVSNLVCLFIWGSAQGWIAWLGLLTAMALAAAWVLSYAPRKSTVLAKICALVAGCLLACGIALHAL
jgi:hypothetical protein